MHIHWTTHGSNVPDPLRSKLEQGLGKVERLLHGPVEARVVVDGHDGGGRRRFVEVVLRSKLGTFAAKDESHDLADSLNAVLQRVETQVRRAHDKMIDGRRRVEEAGRMAPASETD